MRRESGTKLGGLFSQPEEDEPAKDAQKDSWRGRIARRVSQKSREGRGRTVNKERGTQYLVQLRRQKMICKILMTSARDVSVSDRGRTHTAEGWG